MNETTTVPLERLRADIEQFYARHMQLLDGGRAEEWAATFTEDGTFRLPGRPEPSRGRAELAEGARRAGPPRRRRARPTGTGTACWTSRRGRTAASPCAATPWCT
ncbi:nuclear transport factor 2 family protein [Kitasatospora aburaviensis]